MNYVLLFFVCVLTAGAADQRLKERLETMAEQIELLKISHQTDLNKMKKEIEELK